MASRLLLHGLPAAWRELAPFVRRGTFGLPLWVLVVVLGREVFMTSFRQAAAWRGVSLAPSGPAKLKTGFQWTWIGTAFFWFAAVTRRRDLRMDGHDRLAAAAAFIGIVGVVTMTGAVTLTLYSLGLVLAPLRRPFAHRADHNRG